MPTSAIIYDAYTSIKKTNKKQDFFLDMRVWLENERFEFDAY